MHMYIVHTKEVIYILYSCSKGSCIRVVDKIPTNQLETYKHIGTPFVNHQRIALFLTP